MEKSKENSPWFLLVIVGFSIYFGTRVKGDANQIAANTSETTPYMHMTVQAIPLITQ